MNDFKERIEKEFIIEEVFVEMPSNNHQLTERIKISLESIDLKNITINFIDFDYSEQGEYLHEILEKKEAIEKRQKVVDKANEYMVLASTQIKEAINLTIYVPDSLENSMKIICDGWKDLFGSNISTAIRQEIDMFLK